MSWAAVAVTAVNIGAQYLEEEPDVPMLARIDPTVQGRDAANANLAALPAASELGSKVNAFNQAELDKAFADIFPGYKDAARKAGSNIEDLLTGKISAETSAEISRNAATRAVGRTGTFGPSDRALEARDFGITSEAMKASGLTALSGWLASAKGSLIAPKFDVTSMFITPQQLYQQRNEQELQQFQRQNAANQVDAYYSWNSRLGRGLQNSASSIGSIAGGGMGGMMGGGGGGGASQSSGPNYQMVDFGASGYDAGSVNPYYTPSSYGKPVSYGNPGYNPGSFSYSNPPPSNNNPANWWGF